MKGEGCEGGDGVGDVELVSGGAKYFGEEVAVVVTGDSSSSSLSNHASSSSSSSRGSLRKRLDKPTLLCIIPSFLCVCVCVCMCVCVCVCVWNEKVKDVLKIRT